MPIRNARPPLKLVFIGILLYFGIAYLWPFFGSSGELSEEPPQPSITQTEAADAAGAFVKKRFGLSADHSTHVVVQSHTDQSGYLQKEHLLEEYNKRFSERYPLDYYEVEVRDGPATYYIDIDFEKRTVLGFSAFKSSAAKSNAVSSGEKLPPARMAEATIRDMGYDPMQFTLASPNDQRSSNIYVFASKKETIGDTRLELHVGISGSEAVSFHAKFPPSAAFTAWKEAQDGKASIMTGFSLIGLLLLALAAFVIVIKHRKEIRFAQGLLLTLIFMGVYILNNYNMLPAFRTMHGSGPSEPDAVLYLWINNIYVALMSVTLYFSLLAGCSLSLKQGMEPWKAWREPEFGSGILRAMRNGYVLGLFILGVQQTLFFGAMLGFDVWAVNDPAESVYNMVNPIWFPLMAWSAAISEEAIYRLLAVTLLLKLFRGRLKFLAVLVPSVIWAMSHTQYPIYPVYTRLIEVTIIGLVFGFAFLKYGFMTAVFAHATMDSILMGLSLMATDDTAYAAAGIVYLLVPAAVGWLLYKLHGRFNRLPPAARPHPFQLP